MLIGEKENEPTLVIPFKYETGGIRRWVYLNVFQANYSCGSKTYKAI